MSCSANLNMADKITKEYDNAYSPKSPRLSNIKKSVSTLLTNVMQSWKKLITINIIIFIIMIYLLYSYTPDFVRKDKTYTDMNLDGKISYKKLIKYSYFISVGLLIALIMLSTRFTIVGEVIFDECQTCK